MKIRFLPVTIIFFCLLDNIRLEAKEKFPGESFLQSSKKIEFTENKGQILNTEGKAVSEVLFKAESNGIDIYITQTGLTYVLNKVRKNKHSDQPDPMQIQPEELNIEWAAIEMELEGAFIDRQNMNPEIPCKGVKNYYLEHYPAGILNVRSFQEVIFKNIYPGIDWKIYTHASNSIKYDFIVHPGADPGRIQLKYNGSQFPVLLNDGSILNSTRLGSIREDAPFSYLESGGMHVGSRFRLEGNKIKLETDSYNQKETLIIDPGMTWSTYYGGSNTEYPSAITSDNAGNIYITGTTSSTNFPTIYAGPGTWYQGVIGGSSDVFIIKFNSIGELKWASFYGGTSGDVGNGIVTAANGSVFVTGYTASAGFPLYASPGSYNQPSMNGTGDIFILRFDSTGLRNWATYFGGSSSDFGYDLTIDNSDNIYLAGHTLSLDFPTLHPGGFGWLQAAHGGGSADGFISKFTSGGVLAWSTYYGGSTLDFAHSLITDEANNLYVVGQTQSSNFPKLNPLNGAYYQNVKGGTLSTDYDCFILKFNGALVRKWATYYGGEGSEAAWDIESGPGNTIYITGPTGSPDFPLYDKGSCSYFQSIFGGVIGDAFLLEFDTSGIQKWATFYGGADTDRGTDIDIDQAGNLYLAGHTLSLNFPTQNSTGSYNQTYAGAMDAFIVLFDTTGERQWATCIGGSDQEGSGGMFSENVECHSNGNIYFAGMTNSTDYPIMAAAGAFNQGLNNGAYDMVITKFEAPLIASCAPLAQNSIILQGFHSEEGNKLSWSSENDYISYEIEKAGESKKFVSIGKLLNVKERFFTDNKPWPGKNYYRIKGTDQKGNIIYSNIIEVTFEIVSDLNIYPNPASDELQIDLNNIPEDEKQVTIELQDMPGRSVFQKTILLQEGNNHMKIDLENIPVGIYLFIIRFSDRPEYKKISICR